MGGQLPGGNLGGMPPGQIHHLSPAQQIQWQNRTRQPQLMTHNQQMSMPGSGPPMSNGLSAQMRAAQAPQSMAQIPAQISNGAPPIAQQMPPQHPPAQLTPQDHQIIDQMAETMFRSARPDQIEQIRIGLQNTSAEQLAAFRSAGKDPMAMYFRLQAQRQYLAKRNLQPGPNTSMTGGMGNFPMNHQPANSFMSNQSPQAIQNGNFPVNVNQFQSQQETALKSAQQGHQVVPISNVQGGPNQVNPNAPMHNSPAPFAGAQPMPRQNISQPERAYQERVQQLNRQQQTMSATNQMRSQGQGAGGAPNTPHTPARQGPQTPGSALKGQPGGLGPGANQPQVNGMPNLNKAVSQNKSTPNTSEKLSTPQQKPPSGPQQIPASQRAPMRPPTEDQVKRHLATLGTDDERRKFMFALEKRRREMGEQGKPQTPNTVAQPSNHQPPNPTQLQPPIKPMTQRPGVHRPPLQHNMTPEQRERLDSMPYPKHIVSINSQLRPPENIVSWGDLKRWASVQAGLPPAVVDDLSVLQIRHIFGGQISASTAPMAPASMASHLGFQIPKIPPPNEQEIMQSRGGFPNMSDDQVRDYIILKKHGTWAQSQLQNGAAPQLQASLREYCGKVSQQMKALSTQSAETHNVNTSQPAQISTVTKAQGQAPVTTKKPTQANDKKGVKRSSNGEVSSTSNATSVQQGPTKPAATSQQPKRTALTAQQPPQTRNGSAEGPNQQKLTVIQNHAAVPAPSEQISTETRNKLQKMNNEIVAALPSRKTVDLSTQEKASIEQHIYRARLNINKLLPLILISLQVYNNEKRTKMMLQAYHFLISQFRGGNLNAGFQEKLTISHAECQKFLGGVNQFVHQCLQDPQVADRLRGGVQPNQPLKEATPALSASNLHQQQIALQNEREADIKKNHASNRAPAAPTSAKPPFPFTPPPDSTTYIGPPGFAPESLHVPDKKKRKTTASAAASPSLAAKASPAMPKQAEAPKPKVKPTRPLFRCPENGCGSSVFSDQASLQKHRTEAHAPKPAEIGNPLAFSLEKMRNTLGVDANGKRIVKQADEPMKVEAPMMKASDSTQSRVPVKQEAPSTSMSRAASQMSTSSAKFGKDALSKASARQPPQAMPAESSSQQSPADVSLAWSDSLIDPNSIRDAFSSLREPLSLSGHLSESSGDEPDLTPESLSTDNGTAGTKTSPSPKSSPPDNPDLGVRSPNNLELGGTKAKDLDSFLNWYPDEWKPQDSVIGDFPTIDVKNYDLDMLMTDNFGGEDLVPFDQYLKEFGVIPNDMDLS